MKTRLLKKLRDKFYLEKINNEFRVYEYTDSGIEIYSDWMSLKNVIKQRRDLILGYARRNHKVAKKSYIELI